MQEKSHDIVTEVTRPETTLVTPSSLKGMIVKCAVLVALVSTFLSHVGELNAASSTTYNFNGTTTAGPHDAYRCDTDQMPPEGANLNSKTQASNANYSSLASIDNNRWTTQDPGNADEMFLWLDMAISEASADVTQIDLTFEGQCNQSCDFAIWVYNHTTASWSQVGAVETGVSNDTDRNFTRSILSNCDDYISATNVVTWGVLCTNDSELCRYDYVETVIHQQPVLEINGTQDFGSSIEQIQSVTSPITYTLQNVGSTDLTVTAIALNGGAAADYTLSNLPFLPTILPAGGTSTFDVSFTPSTTGTRATDIRITSDTRDVPGTNTDYAITGSGTASNSPVLEVSGTQDFGNSNVGSTSPTSPITYTMNNTGGSNLTVQSITLVSDTTYDTSNTTFADGPHNIFYCDLDNDNQAPTGGNLNDKIEANDAEYIAAGTSDNSHFAAIDPDANDELFYWFDFEIAEDPANITNIDLTFEGNASEDLNFQIWVYNVTADSWSTLGGNQAATAGVDVSFTRSITSNFSNYISPQNTINWGCMYSVRSTGNCDYASVKITTTPSDDFVLGGLPTFPVVIPSGGLLTFAASFIPSIIGTRETVIRINSDTLGVGGTDTDYPITGFGTQPDIAISGTQDFGNSYVGTASASSPITYTLDNNGDGPLTISSIDVIESVSTIYSEGFESGFGTWSQSGSDDIDWSRSTNGSTPSNGTGPDTYGAQEGSAFIFTEASDPNNPDKTAYLDSQAFDLTGLSEVFIKFYYHMWDSGQGSMGDLKLQVSTDGGTTFPTTVWQRIGSQGDQWFEATADLSPWDGQTIKLRFFGITGGDWAGDVTIDNITIYAGQTSADWTIDTSGLTLPGESIAAGGSATFTSTFTATTTGARTALIRVISDTGNVSGSGNFYDLTGTGVTPIPLSTISGTNDFGQTNLNVASVTSPITYTITNDGALDLILESIAPNSGDAAMWSVDTTGLTLPGETITPGNSVTFTATFTPTTSAGDKDTNLRVVSNTGGSAGTPDDYAVTGEAVIGPIAVISGTVDFGDSNVGSDSTTSPITYTLTNVGDQNLTLESLVTNRFDTADWTIDSTGITLPGEVIAPGGNVTFTATFNPLATGARKTTLQLRSDTGGTANTPTAYLVTGNGTQPTLGVSGTQNFGNVFETLTSTPTTYTITNSGDGPLTITSITLNSGNTGDFALAGLPSFDAVVPVGGSIDFTATFSPTTTGYRTTNIRITSDTLNVPGTNTDYQIYGTGLTAIPLVDITGTSDFGNSNVGVASASSPITYTITNVGVLPLTITNISTPNGVLQGGDFADDLSGTTLNAIPELLAAGENITVDVSFTPSALGLRAAVLRVTSNTGGIIGTTTDYNIRGNGVSGQIIQVTGTQDFGSSGVGVLSASSPITYTITNIGDSDLTVTNATVIGAHPSDFALDLSGTTLNGTPEVIAASGSITVQVNFTPSAEGVRNASLRITSDTGTIAGSLTDYTLTGEGTISATPGLWTGATNTNWNVSTNWDDGSVPNGTAATIQNVANQPIISTAVDSITALTINSGATLTLASGGSIQTTTSMAVNGALSLQGNSILTLSDGVTITVANGATLEARGTDSSASNTAAEINSPATGTDSWSITVDDGGILDLRSARLFDGVLTASATAPAEIRLSDVLFEALPSGAGNAFIDLTGVASGELWFNNLSFTRGSAVVASIARNIAADATTKETVVLGYEGDLAGETFDSDASNKITWINSAVSIKIDEDSALDYVGSIDQALDNLTTTATLKIYASYLDASGDLVSSGSTILPTLTLPDFSGTLELDGFTFMTSSSSATLIDTSAVVSGGVIKLFNCMLVDPNDASGTGRALVNEGGTITAEFCTIDTNNATTAGISGATTNCHFTRAITSSYYINAAEGNFHLTKTGHDNVFNGAGALTAGHERDIDGQLRPDATSSDSGADYYGSDDTAASIIGTSDVTGGAAADASAVIVEGPPIINSSGDTYYLSSHDGVNCYLSAISRINTSVLYSTSWAGYRCSAPTFIQTSDAAGKFWVYVPYDTNADGDYDTIRRVLHTAGVGFSSSSAVGDGSGNLTSSDGSDADITLSSGWNGNLFLLSTFITGDTESLIAMTTQEAGGEIHTFYVNTNSSNGNFYAESTFTTAARAAETFTSGAVNINPNPNAGILLNGAAGSGALLVTRIVDGSNSAGMLRIDRTTDGDISTNILNSLTLPASGESFSTTPTFISGSPGANLLSVCDNNDKITAYYSTVLTPTTCDVGLGGAGEYAGPAGVNPRTDSQAKTTLVPMYNASTGKGAVIAMEYSFDDDNDANYEILGATYSEPKLRYTGDGQPGSFSDGIAAIAGQPTALLYSRSKETAWCSTSAGLLYAWEVANKLSVEDTNAKGALRANYPLSVPGGMITQLGFHLITDATMISNLGLVGASAFVVGCYTNSGQLILVRQPS